jgi:uncharacterized membrane protein
MLALFGTAVLSVVVGIWAIRSWAEPSARWALAGALTHWTVWNHLRGAAAIAAGLAFVIALIRR